MKHIKINGTDKGTIVFIHGNSSSSGVFKKVMESNSITSTKIAVDLPGHGANIEGFKNESDFSICNYRDKLVSFINQLDDDIILAGNSLGGHIAIEIATLIPRLKGLVIFGTPPLKKPLNLQEAFLPIPALQTFFTENPTDKEIETSAYEAVFKEKDTFKIIEDFKRSNPKVRKAIVADIAESNFLDEFNIFINLKIPKLIIAGKQDPSVNPHYLEEVKNSCNGTCKLVKFDECGHYPSLEKPKEFTIAINQIIHKIF
jgi:pimeloyl-ACP methyl ester carboxylesterase